MEKERLLERIVISPKVMVGKPVIKGTRLTVQYILGLLAHGATADEILQEYEGLTREDILACLLFADERVANKIKVLKRLLKQYANQLAHNFVVATETTVRIAHTKV